MSDIKEQDAIDIFNSSWFVNESATVARLLSVGDLSNIVGYVNAMFHEASEIDHFVRHLLVIANIVDGDETFLGDSVSAVIRAGFSNLDVTSGDVRRAADVIATTC